MRLIPLDTLNHPRTDEIARTFPRRRIFALHFVAVRRYFNVAARNFNWSSLSVPVYQESLRARRVLFSSTSRSIGSTIALRSSSVFSLGTAL